MQVIKRDGRILNFEREKIVNAITNAFKEVDGQELSEATISKIESVADAIEKKCESKNLSVEEIQDLVEEKLMASNRKDVAKTYILYRANRSKIRERKSELRKKIKEKLSASNVQNQNANIDEYSFGGRVGEASEELQKELALDEYVSEMARNNHINNEIYIHDLGSFPIGNHNCLTIPFDKLLSEGFNTRQTDVRPANSISTAFQLVAVIFQLQSLQQFGGVSASHIDWTMIPYVRKSFYKHYKDGLLYLEDFDVEHLQIGSNTTSIENDVYKSYPKVYKYAMDLTVRECNQAVEAMFHNLNTLQSRSGNQLEYRG